MNKNNLLKMFRKNLRDVLSHNPDSYVYQRTSIFTVKQNNTGISIDRFIQLINGHDIPTIGELYALTSLISIDLLENVYKALYPDYSDVDIEHFAMLYLYYQILDKKNSSNFRWQDLEEKLGFTKQMHHRFKLKAYGKASTNTINKLVGFLPDEIINNAIEKLHFRPTINSIDSKNITKKEFIELSKKYSRNERANIILKMIKDFDVNDKLSLVSQIV